MTTATLHPTSVDHPSLIWAELSTDATQKVLVKADASGKLLTSSSSSGVGGTLTNRSGSITTGGTAQTLAAANSSRVYFFVHNISVGDLWINFTTTAIADSPSIKLVPGASFVMESAFVSTELVNIIGATTGQKFVAKEG